MGTKIVSTKIFTLTLAYLEKNLYEITRKNAATI